MSKINLKVPNIGEFKDVEVIEVLISEGQTIKKNDPLITIESDKSSVEIPSTEEGKILKVNIKVGDKVSENDKILELETEKIEIKEEVKIEKREPFNKQTAQDINVAEDDNNNKKDEVFKISEDSNALASPKARKFARELGVNINQAVKDKEELQRMI